MRATIIGVIIAFLVSILICVFSMREIRMTTERMTRLHSQALTQIGADDIPGALETLREIAALWKEHEPLFEMLATHGNLHEVSVLIAESYTLLEGGETDNFITSMSALAEAIEHIWEEEQLSLSNIL